MTHLAIHSMPSVTPAPVNAEHGLIIQSLEPIVFEQSWKACFISNKGKQPSMSCLFPRINNGAVSNDVDLKWEIEISTKWLQSQKWAKTYPNTLSKARFDSISRSGSAESIINITPWQSLKYLSQSDWSSSCPPKSQNMSFTPCVLILPMFRPTVVVIFDSCIPRYSEWPS